MSGSHGSDDDLRARVLLAHLSEPADGALGIRIAEVGAVQVADEVIRGRCPIPSQRSLLARLAGSDPHGLVQRDLEAADRCGARALVPATPEWPRQLDDLGERAPLLLWARGAADLRLTALRSLAVVGTRTATPYGEAIARRWSADLASSGWTIVSGAAFGIDAAAHRGALSVEGVTVCVLACGVDVAYPRSHDALIADIAASGLVISESPPGGAAMRNRFLTRNRLIAALSRATLVVEAALRSGTRSTATEAGSMGRPVLAVPGPVTSPVSAGCHLCIREGSATLVTGVDEVLRELGVDVPDHSEGLPPPVPAVDALGARESRVFDCLPLRRPVTIDALSRSAGVPVPDLVAALGRLQLLGLVHRSAEGWAKQAPRGA